ncbi:MAG: F0F1 ATP synthase subunit A [Terriglobales bacterium]
MHEPWFTHLLNAAFGGPALALLHALHIQPANPQAPIPNFVAMEILVAVFLAVLGTVVGRGISVEDPRGWQHIFEWLWTGLDQHAEEVIGHEAHRFLGFIFTLTIFIFAGNLLGLIPTFESPTGSEAVTLGLAVVAFVYYHWSGVRKQGAGHYLKQFAGPMPAIAPLMVPIEIISHCARILSLSVRLYANMFAGDMVIVMMTALVPIAGAAFMGFHVFEALLQTYIFVLLTMVYLAGAVAEEH